MSVYHPYITVIGRIPFDDEDTFLHFENMTINQAYQAFSDEMFEGLLDKRENYFDEAGELGVFINAVLVSDSPIRGL